MLKGAGMICSRSLERDDFSSSHHPALSSCFARDLFRKPVPTFRDHALIPGAHLAPALERRPEAAVEPEAIDRCGRGQRTDPVEPNPGPLEAALLQHPARGRIAHARAASQAIAAEVAEGMIDHAARRLGGVAPAPERDAQPVTDLGLFAVAPGDPAGA